MPDKQPNTENPMCDYFAQMDKAFDNGIPWDKIFKNSTVGMLTRHIQSKMIDNPGK